MIYTFINNVILFIVGKKRTWLLWYMFSVLQWKICTYYDENNKADNNKNCTIETICVINNYMILLYYIGYKLMWLTRYHLTIII